MTVAAASGMPAKMATVSIALSLPPGVPRSPIAIAGPAASSAEPITATEILDAAPASQTTTLRALTAVTVTDRPPHLTRWVQRRD